MVSAQAPREEAAAEQKSSAEQTGLPEPNVFVSLLSFRVEPVVATLGKSSGMAFQAMRS